MISPWRDGSIHETSERIRAGTVSPVTIVDACLQRIDHLNPTLNAFATILPDEARAQARHAEAEINGGRWIGPLHGIPVGIKDFYVAGGSSGGSAAAIAAGMCYATIDTDAIGSCRLPATCCGVIGFKGTYGLISARGILDGEPADPPIVLLSHPAITTRSAHDTAAVLQILAERETKTTRQPRVGVVTNIKPTQSVRTAFDAAVERLRALGYTLRTTTAPFDNPGFDVRNINADRKAIAARSFREIDVLVLPTTNGGIPTVRQAQHDPLALSAENTMFANYFGLPAISVPSGLDAKGLPLGLQIVGRPWEDGTVLDLANTFLTRPM